MDSREMSTVMSFWVHGFLSQLRTGNSSFSGPDASTCCESRVSQAHESDIGLCDAIFSNVWACALNALKGSQWNGPHVYMSHLCLVDLAWLLGDRPCLWVGNVYDIFIVPDDSKGSPALYSALAFQESRILQGGWGEVGLGIYLRTYPVFMT